MGELLRGHHQHGISIHCDKTVAMRGTRLHKDLQKGQYDKSPPSLTPAHHMSNLRLHITQSVAQL